MAFNDIRKKMPCRFNDGFSQEEFETLAYQLGKKIKRITKVLIDGAIVYCSVESQSHISEWFFAVDYNDWGHVTGTFWTESDNQDSSIPHNFGMTLSGLINQSLKEKEIYLRDMSDDVDNHEDLDQLIANGIHCSRSFGRYIGDKIFRKKRQITLNYSDGDLKGEHIYPIFAILMDSGFVNISAQAVKDINDRSKHYEYEISQISIAGVTSFERGESFDYKSEVVITYHAKKEIVIPFKVNSLIRQNYVKAGDRLQKLGFRNIYERKTKDLISGIINKDGSTKKVVVVDADGNEVPIQNDISYPYDTQIIICYHTYKFSD